jgi:hypothetical protein
MRRFCKREREKDEEKRIRRERQASRWMGVCSQSTNPRRRRI